MKKLAGKVALVTGGAGGIGAGICEVLAGAGAAVVVGYNQLTAVTGSIIPVDTGRSLA